MHGQFAAIAQGGYVVLFAWIAAGQLGAPVPAIPMLIAAGLLSAAGRLTLGSALVVGTLGCLAGDTAWYVIGRRRGSEALRVLCRISLNRETCVRRGSEFISRHGDRALIVAKFIPGVSTVAVPLAANSGSPPWLFFLYDFLGSLLFVGAFLVAGRVIGSRIDQLLISTISTGSIWADALGFAVIASLAIVGWRYYQKQRFHNAANVARITPEELLELMEKGQGPYIVDLRHPLDMLADPRMVPGAIRMTPDELSARQQEIPRDREIILYCT